MAEETEKDERVGYEIIGDKAFVNIIWDKKPAKIGFRKLNGREWAYSLDEFMTINGRGDVKIKIGAMILSVVPKSIVDAPFDISDRSKVLEHDCFGPTVLMNIQTALNELNGGGELKNSQPASV